MMRPLLLAGLLTHLLFNTNGARAESDLLQYLSTEQLKAMASQISGEHAKRNLDQITQYHRMRASEGFNDAADFVLKDLKANGYPTATTLSFPADGKTLFGTQKSRLAWNVAFAELWELQQQGADWRPAVKMGDWAARPLTLAQDSDSADVTAELIDIGAGTEAGDYAGKDIRGKIVLTSSQPEGVEKRAIVERGAVGILSYAANQHTAWWQLDDSLVRWGHLTSFRNYAAFGFMISLGEARELIARLATGETIKLHAKIKATREKADYRLVTAVLPGSDPTLKNEEIVFSCHLDHPRPGANDNASGCVAILEVARSFKRLVDQGQLPPPKRSIRFIWPSEIEASLIFLNAKPNMAARIKHLIHMDMVGGGPETKAVFRVSRGPFSVADISGELSDSLVDFVNQNTLAFASGENTEFPLTAPEGGREPLLAQKEWLSMGSDHDVFASGSWSIPITYLHDWPDRYIHTTKDLPDFIDPTKLKRAAFIGLVQATLLANLDQSNAPQLQHTARVAMIERTAQLMAKKAYLTPSDFEAARRGHAQIETLTTRSIGRYAPQTSFDELDTLAKQLQQLTGAAWQPEPPLTSKGDNLFHHNPKIKGTMHGFGYDYLIDKLGDAKADALKLSAENAGDEKCYEALNLVDGKRTLDAIHDVMIAEFGPTSKTALREYLDALASIGVLQKHGAP